MTTVSDRIIDAFGGSSALSHKSKIPLSTVHSWRQNGIPRGRRGHLELLASTEGKVIDWETGRLVAGDGCSADHADSDTTAIAPPSPGIDTQFSPMEAVHG